MLDHAGAEQTAHVLVVRYVQEVEVSNIVHISSKFGGQSCSKMIDREFALHFTNNNSSLLFLGLNILPRQSSTQEVHENITE